MNLEHIDVFVSVVENGSFTRAAKQLNRPTSTVSAQIAKLERTLNTTLLHRTTKQVSVTAAGQHYYSYCVDALSLIAKAEHTLSELTLEPSGTLRITAPADFSNTILSSLVKNYCDQYPKMSVELLITNKTVELIKENVDLAVRIGPLIDSSLVARRFMEIKGLFWASSDYFKNRPQPKTLQDLIQHNLIRLLSIGDELTLWHKDGYSEKLTMSGNLASDDVQTNLSLVKAGAGIALLPDFLGDSTRQLQPVLPSYSTQPAIIYLVYPKQPFVSLPVRSFIDYALEYTQT